MRQFPAFWDRRQAGWCAYCAGDPLTRDHVPSRVLLDEPYPDNLPVVPACQGCNVGLSEDEEYTACLIECVVAGSATPSNVRRAKVRRILMERPALAARLAAARSDIEGAVHFAVEDQRLCRVLLKLARGHALYELNEPQHASPSLIAYAPLGQAHSIQRTQFETLPMPSLWPEVGSRAMQRMLTEESSPTWVVVQNGRYRYFATVADGIIVRMVLSEYLACEVKWQ